MLLPKKNPFYNEDWSNPFMISHTAITISCTPIGITNSANRASGIGTENIANAPSAIMSKMAIRPQMDIQRGTNLD